jgi:hypothetical protein
MVVEMRKEPEEKTVVVLLSDIEKIKKAVGWINTLCLECSAPGCGCVLATRDGRDGRDELYPAIKALEAINE